MVLSNAERQARFRQSRKARAQGVTPEMVEQAARMIFECDANPEFPSWEEWCAISRKRSNANMWQQFWMISADAALLDAVTASGGDADLVERVLAVARAVLLPPAK